MTLKTIFLAGTAALFTALPSLGVRALETPRTVTQPDGTQLAVKRVGDERSHFLLTSDGCLLAEQDGLYTFGTLDARGRVVSTGVQASGPMARTAAQNAVALRMSDEALRAASRKRAASAKRAIAQTGLGRFTSSYPRTGDINALVILVEYKDVKFTLDDPKAYFDEMLHKDGFSQYGGTGCAVEYFREQSLGQFNPHFDLYGPVTLPNNRRYYGGNDAYGNDRYAEEMVVDAVKALDPQVDFSKYDNDGDGVLDNVFIFYAGQGEASYGPSESVWPHSWDLSSAGQSFKVDGVTVNSYACTNEWEQNRPDGVGTFIHEFSHVIGLPDLYDTYGDLLCTPGSWSVLDYGPYNNDGCTPPNYSVFERNAMGWIEPRVLDGPSTVTLKPIATNEAAIIQTPKTNEFFLFENRQKEGWDKYLPGHGMLIWHVDFNQSVWDDNSVNNSSSHQYVEIEKANGVFSSDDNSVLAGWAWPGTAHATEFTDSSKPSMKTWAGQGLGLPVTGITEKDGLISFMVAGGYCPFEAPVALTPANVGVDWFEAAWEPVEGATDYLLTVKAITEGSAEETHSADMGSGKTFRLPDGWSSSSTENYSTTGNYGQTSPSYKMAKDGAYLESPIFDADVLSISFWYKGQNSAGSVLTVEGLTSEGEFVTLDAIIPAKNAAENYVIDNIPAGIRAVRFVYSKSTGNLALDDVEIVTGGDGVAILPGYDNVSTSGMTSMIVSGLDPAAKGYSYIVKATDGTYTSAPSDEVEVALSSTGVAAVAGDVTIRIEGRNVHADGCAEITVSDIAGRIVSRGSASALLPSAGIYVVKAGAKTLKVVVR